LSKPQPLSHQGGYH